MIDPEHLHTNVLPPPVHVLAIEADGKAVDLTQPIMLPPLTRSIQFSFTGLSFTVPRKVRFRYKLEPFDGEWRDGGSSREASYTNLLPGAYTFRVRASNNDGIWNEAGAALPFFLAPAFFQTLWFRLLSVAVVLLSAISLFRLRLRSARRMTVDLRYGAATFELTVHDEGDGMTDQVLQVGIPGHYGLAGMRERAARMEAEIAIISSPGRGTTVRVSLPAARAYQNERSVEDSRALGGKQPLEKSQ